MKFRYKVLIINIVLLSVSLGIVGYLMIRNNFRLAQDTQMQNAIVENNLVQSSVEYELLEVLNSAGYHISEDLSDIGTRVAGSMLTIDSCFYVKYGNDYVYSGDGEEGLISETLFDNLDEGGKNCMTGSSGERHYIYVSSCSRVNERYLYIITKSDISEAYNQMNRQITYFRILIMIVLLAASIIMYTISRYLTRPLETLTCVTEEIAGGCYDTRVEVKTGDEIGQLADSFNRMAEAVSEHVEELQDMIHRRDQFVADFTHEIKTPMTTIIGYADTMRSMELPREEQIMSLNYIFSEGKRLEVMSGKLFELIYLKQHEIARQPIHVEDMINEIARIVSPALLKKRITLTTEVDPAVISGNRELLVTAFVNLVDNARKASAEDSSIELSGCVVQQENYALSVIDHGIGMTEEDTARICDEFYMVDKSRSRREGGAGIGMSLVALILERHGAVLNIESVPGEGTKMQVVFSEVMEGAHSEENK